MSSRLSSRREAVAVRGLSKAYTIAHNAIRQTTMAEALAHRLRHPFQRVEKETFWALKDVTFEIAPGEVVGIIGRNGAGKSTLLKILSRITEPTEGEVSLYGRVGSLLEVGTGFHPELTGRENIYLNGAILGMARREISRQFEAIVEFSETERFLDTPVKRYSSGMYVRLAFAVAAHLQPEILIVDEVLSVGDIRFQRKCLSRMEDVAKAGRTVLFVSHNLEAVARLSTSGLLMAGGRVDYAGGIDDVIRRYVDSEDSARSLYHIAPPDDQTAPAHALWMRFEDLQGNPVPQVPVAAPWQVRVHVCVTRPVEYLVVGLGLTTPYDLPVRTTWSQPQRLQPGQYQAVFREESLQLEPGFYPVVVGLTEHDRSIHYVEKAGTLLIAEAFEASSVQEIHRTKHCGLILNQMRVSVGRVADAA